MTNRQVIEKFLNKEQGKTNLRDIYGWSVKGRTLYTNGEEIINYNTRLAYFIKDKLYLNMTKYSPTTSKIQHEIRRLAENKGIEIEEYLQLDNYTEY